MAGQAPSPYAPVYAEKTATEKGYTHRLKKKEKKVDVTLHTPIQWPE